MQEPFGLLRSRLGGRANSAIYAGRAVPCPERKLKSATTCFRAGFYLPAAGPMLATAVESQISKAPTMTITKSDLRVDDQSPAHVPGVCVSRRNFLMNSVVSLPIIAAVPTAAPAISPAAEPAADPIFAALEVFRLADEKFYAVDGDIPDEIGDRWSRAVDLVIRTRPKTPAGLVALTGFVRDMVARSNRGDAGFGDKQWTPAIAAIDDATRGMAGLRPWSTPAALSEAGRPHRLKDSKLIELGREFERLLLIERSLEKEKNRLDDQAHRIRCKNMGLDPDNRQACLAAGSLRNDEWCKAWDAAATDVGYNGAWKTWNRASSKTGRVGKKILKITPATLAGLMVRLRVIETHDEVLKVERDEQLLTEIKTFDARVSA
jgi:hypothetical protein